MLSEELEGINILDELGVDDCKIIMKAKRILASNPTLSFLDETNDSKTWLTDNVECQSSIQNLKSRVDYLMWSKHYEAIEMEGSELERDEDLRLDFKSREDRLSIILSRDNTLKDLKLTEKHLECISKYLESLLWGLRNSLTTFRIKS